MAYQPNNWNPLDIITSEKLNDLEQGLLKASENNTFGHGGANQPSDGIHSFIVINKGDPMPSNPQPGDTVFIKDGDDYTMVEWNGEEWALRLDPKLSERIDKVLDDAKTQSEQLISDNNNEINNTIDAVTKEKIALALADADFNEQAQVMADKALSDAKANTATVAQETLDSANANIADAKKSVSDDIAKEASDRATAVSALDTKAQGYADTAKKNAIDVATSADGVINKKIDDTASSITSTVSQNKKDADGKISTAQSTATQALNGLSNKVDTYTYNAKTGQLSTDITNVTQTANQAKTDIASIKQTDTTQDARMTTIEADADGTKTTVSNLQKTQGKQSGDISTLQQRADGFDATVTKVNNLTTGDRNYILDTTNPKTQTSNGKDNQDLHNSAVFYSPIKNWGIANGDYIISFDWTLKTALSSDMQASVFFNQSPWDPQNFTVKSGKLTGHVDLKFKLDQRILTATQDVTSLTFRIMSQMASGNTITYYNLFMKSGTIVTTWTPAPEDLSGATAKAQLTADQATTTINTYKTSNDGRVASAESKITQNANAITQKVSQTDYDKKTGDLTTKVNTAQSTADSATSTIGSYKTSNDKRIASAESKITANAEAITQKVSQTDYNQKTGELSGSISTLKQRADGFDTTVTKVNNLSVGGRNLLLDTATRTAVGTNVFNTTPNSFRWVLANSATVGSLYIAWGNNAPISVSFDWSITGTTIAGAFNPQWNGAPRGIGYTGAPGVTVSNTNTSGHYTWSSTTQTGWSGSTANKFTLRTDNLQGTLTITNLKFEQGNLPTTWSPAPEDTDNKISTVSQTVDGISSIVSDPTTGLNKRVQTAEGTLSQVTGADIPNLQKATFWQHYGSLDFNRYTKQGSYFFNTMSAKTNGPVSGNNSWTYLMVEQGVSDNSRIKQTAWYDGVNGVKITYVRTLNSGTWSPWYANDNDSVTTISQTNSNVRQEISDRKTGDNNTLQSSKDFTTSSITNYDKGIQSTITQTASGILAQVESTNMVVNSEFDPLNGTWYALNRTALDTSISVTQSTIFIDWPVVDGSRLMNYAAATSYSTLPVNATAGKPFSASLVAGRPQSLTTSTALDFRIGFWDSNKKLISQISAGNIIDGTASKGIDKYKIENKIAPTNTAYVSIIIAHSSATSTDVIGRPMLNNGTSVSPYAATYGTTNSSTILSLFKDNYSFGINADGTLVSGLAGNQKSVTLKGNAITLDGKVNVTNDFYALGGNFKNLNAANLVGTNASFFQANFSNAYGQFVSLDGSGMVVSYSDRFTTFDGDGVKFKQIVHYTDGTSGLETVGSLITSYKGTVNSLMMNLYDQTYKSIGSPVGEIWGGDMIGWSRASDHNGHIDSIFTWSNGTAASNTGTSFGFNFYDRINFNQNEIISGGQYNFLMSSTKFGNGFFGGKAVPSISSTWSGNTGGGIAFGTDNVIIFAPGKTKIIL